MKKKRSAILKWLLLAVCLFVAGCFYSCGIRKTEQGPETVQKNRAFQAESAPESSREITGEDLEYPEDTEAFLENGAAEHTADAKQGKTDSIPENSNMTETALCYVYVCGKVRSPGVYTLPEGARIYEAVDLAGGFTDDAEDSWLNLAEPVTDGMKLEVPSKAQAGDPAWQAQNQNALTGNRDAGNSVAGQHVLVNLNTASLEELMTLKGIGASRAEDIIRYRKEAGGFTKIEDIMKVPGIKDAAFQKIKENITV